MKISIKSVSILNFILILLSLLILISSVSAGTDKPMSVAVIEFDIMGDLEIKDAGAIIAEWMVSSVGKTGKFSLKERVLLKRVLKEQELVLTGIIDDKKMAASVGSLYGVQAVIAGGVSRWGNTISVTARLINTTTGTIIKTADVKTLNENEIPNLMDELAKTLAGNPPERAERVIPTRAISKNEEKDPEETPSTGDLWKEPITDMNFIWIEGKCFEMGQKPDLKKSLIDEIGEFSYYKNYSDETPLHSVCLDGFWMGQYEVTNQQFKMFKSKHNSKDYKGNSLGNYSQPVVYVTWDEAKAFTQWMTKNNNGKYKFRLPSESEWEYSCKGNMEDSEKKDETYNICQHANVYDSLSKRLIKFSWENHKCKDPYVVTAPVGSFYPNSFGLYDMLGNAWEWVEDVYSKDSYDRHAKNNPMNKDGGKTRVQRGGSWNDQPASVRCENRGNRPHDKKSNKVSFRVVKIQKK